MSDVSGYRVMAHGSCDVAPSLRSQWRNGPHWHVVWPDGDHWCYEALWAADDRRAELEAMRASILAGPNGEWCEPDGSYTPGRDGPAS